LAAICCVDESYIQVQPSLKSDRFAPHGRFSTGAGPTDDAFELAQGAVQPWGFRNVRRLIPTANIAASGHAAGLEMSLDAQGAMRAAGGIRVAPRDLARFGEMISRRGVADGPQVEPGAWIDDINERGDPEAWTRAEFADMFPQASYRSK
jgi:CubicO group peptidase (beta-lactamase class C family)